MLVIITGLYTYYAAGQLHKMKRSILGFREICRCCYECCKYCQRSNRIYSNNWNLTGK